MREWNEMARLDSVVDFALSVTFTLVSPVISFPGARRFYLEDDDNNTLMRDIVVAQTLMEDGTMW